MSDDQTTHIFEQIEAYLADGLPPDERLAFEAHAASCGQCARALADVRQADAALREVFADARPFEAFEDRIIGKLRIASSPRRLFIHPMVSRAAIGVAAAVVLAGTGLVVPNLLESRNSKGIAALANIERSRSIVAGQDMDSDGIRDLTASQLTRSLSYASNGVDRQSAGEKKEMVRSDEGLHEFYYKWGDSSSKDAEARGFQPGKQFGIDFGRKTVNALGDSVPKDKPAVSPEREVINAGAAGTSGGMGGAGAPPPASFMLVTKTQDLAPAVMQVPAAQAVPDPYSPHQNPQPSQTNPVTTGRKVIRNGTMEFEVASFDEALTRVTKLATEQGGFVATTDSDKLPNGKMKGTLVLRVPPEHLDTLILTLRGVGDLKSQKIAAEDVTKHYTDLESGLRAARAMEERLLDIIKTGKGQIKDLLQAEKELGVWREKIEQIEGEKRYLDNLVAFSTLTVELYERDIKTPASASQTEQVSMSLETEQVDQAYTKAIDAIRAAKGRIVQSELKQFDAGQFGATIQAAIPPDAAEQVIARLRQLPGRFAHFSRDARQTTANGNAAPADVLRVQREDVIVAMQIYNLANVAPRRTTTVQVAVADVERVYRRIIEQVRSAGGRIVTSSLSRPDANVQAAELDVQVPADKADAVQDALAGVGEIMRQESTESADAADVTDAKRGFKVRIASLAAVPPRESQAVSLASANVASAFNEILAAIGAAGGRVLQSGLNQQNPHDVSGTIVYEVPRERLAAVEVAQSKSAQVLSRTIARSADTQNTVDSKLRLSLSVGSAEKLPPREVTSIREEVADVERAADDLVNAASAAGGHRVGNGDVSQQDRSGHMVAQVVVEVPLAQSPGLLAQIERMGSRRGKQVAYDNAVPDGPLARARIDVTFSNNPAALGGEETTWDAIRNGLAVSGQGLRWSLQMLVIGFCFVAPWVLVLWGAWRLLARRRRRSAAPAATP